MAATMVVIKHGLRFVPLGEVPAGKGLLHLAAVRKGVYFLRGQDVRPFNDGKYHAAVNDDAFRELIDAFSAADAADAGFERLDDPSPRYFFGGLRWETSPNYTDLKIFGPKSNPENPFVIDLLNPPEVSDGI
jgi:hypothetical protein